ncbi:MAG: primosomal protein N' [Chloroflexota bacterium]|nr:primosomal protein N' [Chloroflexota bacterium]
MRYAEVALNVPVKSTFTYHIPAELEPDLQLGSLVRVEFGVAMQPGVILRFSDQSDIPKTKPVIELLDPQPALDANAIELVNWLSETYLASIGTCVWLLLPPGFTGASDRRYRFLRDDLRDEPPSQMTLPGTRIKSEGPLPRRLLDYLRQRGPKRLQQLKRAFPKQAVERELALLEDGGMVRSQSALAPPAARGKTKPRVYPLFSNDQIDELAKKLGKRLKHAELLELIAGRDEDALGVHEALELAGAKNRAPLNRLIELGLVFVEKTERDQQDLVFLEATPEEVSKQLSSWRGDEFYGQLLRHIIEANPPATPSEIRTATGASASLIRKLERAGIIEIREERIWRDSLQDLDFMPTAPPLLTPDQQAVWDMILPALRRNGDDSSEPARFLLHGVTGSGKTEIYLRAIAEVLEQGKQAIFLVPEIALTPQTVRRVSERFADRVAMVHGSLPIGERYDTWGRACRGDISVVVGTRSALFTPLPDLGLIILDEEHDASYKQMSWRGQPQYHARDVADHIMTRKGGVLILGSATPDLQSWYRAQKDGLIYLRLPKRIMGHRQRIQQQAQRAGVVSRYAPGAFDALHIDLPPVSVVDMRAELRQGNSSMFSRELEQSLAEALDRGEQAMLLLNRRGQATYVFCRDCGYVLECARCDSPMTYHRFDQSLRCHHCGASQEQPQRCPMCQSSRIRYFGAGTQLVDEALRELFPGARALRWDTDTASNPQMHFEILQRFIDGEADILIGTQMIAKGLDLPLVTLVGVVSADLGLSLPDFRAGERVFQLLTQVAGRAGRGILGGKVVLQTYQPDNYIIQAASRHDYAGFVESEIAYRKALGYPPFRRLARMVFSYTDPHKSQQQAAAAAQRIQHLISRYGMTGTSLIGPAPCYFRRINRHYRWQLLLRGPNPRVILRQLATEPGWQIDLDPIDIL